MYILLNIKISASENLEKRIPFYDSKVNILKKWFKEKKKKKTRFYQHCKILPLFSFNLTKNHF